MQQDQNRWVNDCEDKKNNIKKEVIYDWLETLHTEMEEVQVLAWTHVTERWKFM